MIEIGDAIVKILVVQYSTVLVEMGWCGLGECVQ